MKACRTVALMLAMMAAIFGALTLLTTRTHPAERGDPNEQLARSLLPYLHDGQTFELTQAFPDAWDAVQIVHGLDALTTSEWRQLRSFDGRILELENDQLLIFWSDGEIANAVSFAEKTNGIPWFVTLEADNESFVLGRDSAVFRTSLEYDGISTYYLCIPVPSAAAA